MAITRRAVGAWAAVNATSQTVTLPTHQTGDMLIVFAAMKHASMSLATLSCNTSGWAKVGERKNGTTASGNGSGSVIIAAFWKEAASASETNPVITFDETTAATPGCAVATALTKGASDTWDTPVGDGGDISAATSYSATMASHVSAAAADALIWAVATNDNTTLTVPAIAQTGLTFDGGTLENPSLALSSSTSNDISADGGIRIVLSGTSSAAAVVSGTNSVADPGVAFAIRLRASASGTQYTQDLSGGLSFSGALTKQGRKSLTGGLSFSGTISKSISRSLAGGLSFSGTISKSIFRSFSGGLSFSGALSTSRVFLKSLTGGLSFSGALSKQTNKSLAGGLSFSGAISKQAQKALAGGLSFSGAITKQAQKALTGGLSFSGALSKQTRRAFAAAVSFVGSLDPQKIAGGGNTYFQELAGGLSFSGALSKQTNKSLAGGLSFVGSLVKQTRRALAGGLSFSGSLVPGRVYLKQFAATLSFSGSLVGERIRILVDYLSREPRSRWLWFRGLRPRR